MTEPRWQKMKKRQIAETETLLRLQERWCMNACSRYIHRDPAKDAVWTLHDKTKSGVSAIVVHAKQNLMPVLRGEVYIPPPHFLRGLFGTVPIHSMQGRTGDMLIMEAALEKIGLFVAEKTDYDLMCIDDQPSGHYGSCGPAALVIRKPQFTDMGALAALQAAYEQEEVLPSMSGFSAAVSRMNTERLFTKEQMLVAELGGRLVGKINTNAVTFTRYQVGGVYVHPEYRGLGIGRRMAGEFIASLVAQGRGISLFVKKSNICARRVYQRIGFVVTGDYRISYY
jgi:ribosomal protein S18 acetylase RimI-like enzyme